MLEGNVGIGIGLLMGRVCHGEVELVLPMEQVSIHTNAITLQKLYDFCFIAS